LNEKKSVQLIIEGKYKPCFIEKNILAYNEHEELDIIKLRVVIEGIKYNNTKEFVNMEYAIVDLQKQIPDNVQIACCQTCKHGNFCPFGDAENEIFCLINYIPKNKADVVEIFISVLESEVELSKNELLFWCEKYQKNDKDYYTYNDWNSR